MKFKSQLVTQVSGSIGGLTGARNWAGMYFRARAVPTNPNTPQQQAIRQLMGNLASRWQQTLTAAQREAWAVYAANVPIVNTLGDPRTIPPLSHYTRSNVPRRQAGADVIDDGPTIFSLPEFTAPTFTVSATEDTVSVAFTTTDDWAGEQGGYMLIYASRPQPPSVTYFRGPYRYAGKISGAATPPTSPQVIALPFAVAAGQRVFFRARVARADGRLSLDFRTFAAAS